MILDQEAIRFLHEGDSSRIHYYFLLAFVHMYKRIKDTYDEMPYIFPDRCYEGTVIAVRVGLDIIRAGYYNECK